MNRRDSTPTDDLVRAIGSDDFEAVRALLPTHLPAERRERHQRTVCNLRRHVRLLSAVSSLRMLELLLAQDICVCAACAAADYYKAPIIEAARRGHVDLVRAWLDEGVCASTNKQVEPFSTARNSAWYFAAWRAVLGSSDRDKEAGVRMCVMLFAAGAQRHFNNFFHVDAADVWFPYLRERLPEYLDEIRASGWRRRCAAVAAWVWLRIRARVAA